MKLFIISHASAVSTCRTAGHSACLSALRLMGMSVSRHLHHKVCGYDGAGRTDGLSSVLRPILCALIRV